MKQKGSNPHFLRNLHDAIFQSNKFSYRGFNPKSRFSGFDGVVVVERLCVRFDMKTIKILRGPKHPFLVINYSGAEIEKSSSPLNMDDPGILPRVRIQHLASRSGTGVG